MEFKKEVFLFLLGLAVGVTATSYFSSRKGPSETTSTETLQEKLNTCESQKEEIAEKIKTLDAAAEGKSSDEILAEMMKIFIADWGLKLKFKSTEAKCEIPKAGSPVAEELNPKPSSQSPVSPEMSTATSEQSLSAKKEPAFSKKWESQVIAARDEEEALQAIEKNKVHDLFQIYAATSDAELKDIRSLEGKFVGGLKPQSAKEKPVDIELQLEIKKRTNPPEGNFTLLEFVNGKQTSRSSGKGKFKGLSSHQESRAVFIDRSGGDNVMHLYYVPALDSLVGNDYVKSGKSKLEYNGQIILRKVN